MVGFVFFAPSPRHLGARHGARARPARCAGGAKIVALTVDADDAALDGDRRRRWSPTAATARPGDAGARRRHPGALRPAGDEGDRRRRGRRSRRGRGLRRGRRLRCCSTPSRRATPRCPAAMAWPSTGRCWRDLDPALPCHAVGRPRSPSNVAEAIAHHARAGGRRLLRRRKRAGRQGPATRSGPSSRRRAGCRDFARAAATRVTSVAERAA